MTNLPEIFSIFNVVRIFAVLTVSFFITLLVTPLWTSLLHQHKAGKNLRDFSAAPVFHELHKHKEGTPTMAGVLIWGTVALLTVALWPTQYGFFSRAQTWLPWGIMILAGMLGFIDDAYGVLRKGPNGGGLHMKLRFGLYLVIAAIGAWWFYAKLEFSSINVPFLGDVQVGWWYVPFFMLVIIATAFSANETDGLDGLAAGVFLTTFAAYGAIAFDQGKMDLAVFIAAIIGALVAFLWFNIFPARFFMGDTGSMSLGVVLGVIAMLTNTPLLLIPIGCIFVFESLSVIVQLLSKKLYGKKIFLSTPIHHHFEAKGWHETKVTMRFWMVSAIGAILGLIIFLIDSKIPSLLK